MRTRSLLPLAACAALGLPAAAEATYRGANGNIAVVESNSDRGGEGDTDLRLLGPSGGTVNRSLQHCAYHEFEDLPDERFCPSSPTFSEDGARLAYAIDDRLAVARADGSARVVLPRLTEEDSEPAWTPSGALIFTGKQGGKANLYVVNSDGSGLRQITRGGGESGTVSSRGLIAYDNRGYVRLVRVDGTRGRRLARGGNADFSPSGSTVVFQRKATIFRKAVKRGAKRRRVIKRGREPVFSPNGKRVLFVRDEEAGSRSALFTATPKGKRRKRIFRSVDLSSAGVSGLHDPAWQPRR